MVFFCFFQDIILQINFAPCTELTLFFFFNKELTSLTGGQIHTNSGSSDRGRGLNGK
jgi:hypothetical protein